MITLDYNPSPKQALLHHCNARQILYGGSAGGGKSHALRWDLIIRCLRNPGLQAYLFRKTSGELYKNHIIPITREVPRQLAQVVGGEVRFANGSLIHLCHMNDQLDYLTYQGAEMHVLAVDEAGLFLPVQLAEIMARVRLGGFAPKVVDKDYLPRIILSSNPGGPSHNFLKKRFIDPAPALTTFKDAVTGFDTVYIPARMGDNPHLDQGYAAVFSALTPERARALRDGDWDAVEGAALHTLTRARHEVKQFKVPESWTKFMSLDWGTAKPFSIGWFAVVGEDTVVKYNPHLLPTERNPNRSIFLPAGALVRYAEWYGCDPNRDDTGLYLDSKAVARGIIEREERWSIRCDYRVCDSAIFARLDGPSIAENMTTASEGKIQWRHVRKDRTLLYNEFLSRLAGNPYLLTDGREEQHPHFFVTTGCLAAWRTLPSLVIDPMDPDKGPKDGTENHAYDEICYAFSSRPFTRTKSEWLDEQATLRKGRAVDPYSTR